MSDSTDKDPPADPRQDHLPEGVPKRVPKGVPGGDLPDEQQLEAYLRGGSAVSRQYRQLHNADVPAELDRLVLRQAQEAVKSRPAKSRAWMRWSGPLALAASAVLVVSIVIESGVHEEVSLTAPASAPVEAKVLRQSVEQSVERAASEPGAPAGASAKETVDPATVSARSRFEPTPIESSPPAPARIPDPTSARTIRPIAPPAAAPRPEGPQSESKAEMPSADLERRAHADAGSRETVPRAAITTAQKREADSGDHDLSQVLVTSHRTQRRTAGPRNTVAVPAETSDSVAEQADEPRSDSDPVQWLEDIRRLRKEDKHEQADREWRRFRDAFPDYEVEETDPARGAVR